MTLIDLIPNLLKYQSFVSIPCKSEEELQYTLSKLNTLYDLQRVEKGKYIYKEYIATVVFNTVEVRYNYEDLKEILRYYFENRINTEFSSNAYQVFNSIQEYLNLYTNTNFIETSDYYIEYDSHYQVVTLEFTN